MDARPEFEAVRVVQTGLAMLRQGELVVTAPGSEALFSVLDGSGTLVVEFPVEVEVRIVPACDPEQHVDLALERLTRALDGLA